MIRDTKLKTDLKKILSIALPIIAQCMVSYALVLIDTAFIGNYNLEGLFAINNVIIPFFALTSFFFAFSQGLTIILSQLMGANKVKTAKRACENAFLYNQLISLLYFVFWMSFGEDILFMIGARDQVLILATQYLTVLSFSFLFTGLSLTSVAIFQGLGKTTPIMISSIIKSILNIVFNWVLIFGNLGFPEMGLKGAAIGTVLSDLIGTTYLFIALINYKEFAMRLSGVLNPRLQYFKRIIKISLPIGIEYVLWHSGQVFIIFLLNKISSAAAGAFGIVNVLIGLSFNLYMGIGIATLVLVGNAIGAKQMKYAFRIGNLSLLISLFICTIISTIFVLYPINILTTFTEDKQFIEMLVIYVPFLCLIIFPKAVNVISGYALKGSADTQWQMINQAFGTVIIVILSWYLVINLQMGFSGILWAIFIDEAWRAAANYLRFLSKYCDLKVFQLIKREAKLDLGA